ncbi:T9SS type A sorting domain-containing protein [Candidatus Latescibacterota bacterium]
MAIYNMLGQKVRSLIRDFYGSTGTQSAVWDGMDDNGIHVGSGIYIYQLRSNSQVESNKMLLLDSGGHSLTGSYSYPLPYNTNIAEQQTIANNSSGCLISSCHKR